VSRSRLPLLTVGTFVLALSACGGGGETAAPTPAAPDTGAATDEATDEAPGTPPRSPPRVAAPSRGATRRRWRR
jgi:hypothetical protein